MFMCAAVFFLEFWKRTEIRLAYNWDVLGFEEQEVGCSGSKQPAC